MLLRSKTTSTTENRIILQFVQTAGYLIQQWCLYQNVCVCVCGGGTLSDFGILNTGSYTKNWKDSELTFCGKLELQKSFFWISFKSS
jgi:hypothetical protein